MDLSLFSCNICLGPLRIILLDWVNWLVSSCGNLQTFISWLLECQGCGSWFHGAFHGRSGCSLRHRVSIMWRIAGCWLFFKRCVRGAACRAVLVDTGHIVVKGAIHL